tara:strand:- start:237 stop:515 length:279 start_codon:yes stop_codon:yes gene_type:complete
MFKIFLITVCVSFAFFGCKNNEINDSKFKGKELFSVVCKHPMGHVLKFTLDKHNWDHANNYRNSVWRFDTIAGLTVKVSGPCYTDSSMKIVK